MELKSVAIVLCKTEFPGNIGAVARVMKNMGLSDLRLVASVANINDAKVHIYAHGSEDILKNMKVFKSLDEAIKDRNITIATSARKRRRMRDILTPEEVAKYITERLPKNKIALIFGPESTGLTNEEIEKAQIISKIPTAISYPAINLSHSVMVYAYEIVKANTVKVQKRTKKIASSEDKEILIKHLNQAFEIFTEMKAFNKDLFMKTFREIIDRLEPTIYDIRFFHRLAFLILKYYSTFKNKD